MHPGLVHKVLTPRSREHRRLGSRGWVPCQESSCHVERLMMVRFLSQDGNVMSEEFMGKTDRWDGFQGLKV